MTHNVLVRGHGLLLRTWGPADLESVTALYVDPEARRWSPPLDVSEEKITERLDHWVQQAAGGTPMAFAVTGEQDPDTVLGAIDYRRDLPSPPFSVADVGYSVLPFARRRGVASRALILLTGWLLSPDGGDFHRVQLDHAIENLGSCRVADRAGFTREGVRAGYLPLQDTPDAPVVLHDTCLHGTVRRSEQPTG